MVNIPPIYGDWDVSILDDDLAGILPLQDLESLLHLLPQFSGRPPLFNFALEQTRMYPRKLPQIHPNCSIWFYRCIWIGWLSQWLFGLEMFLKLVVALNHQFLTIFHYKPSILGYPHLWTPLLSGTWKSSSFLLVQLPLSTRTVATHWEGQCPTPPSDRIFAASPRNDWISWLHKMWISLGSHGIPNH